MDINTQQQKQVSRQEIDKKLNKLNKKTNENVIKHMAIVAEKRSNQSKSGKSSNDAQSTKNMIYRGHSDMPG